MSALSGARKAFRETRVAAELAYYRALKRGRVLTFQGKQYPYVYRQYNATYSNERTIELPIAWEAVQQHSPDRVLEIGNVLAHYYPIRHQVLDKYEVAPGVLNADVVDYRPDTRFDLIVSISTLEHVGWDEEPRDPPKFLRAVENLRNMLAPGGRLLVTLPIGYNSEVDRCLEQGDIPFLTIGFVKRISPDNQWREASWSEVKGTSYLQGKRNILGLTAVRVAAEAVAIGTVGPERGTALTVHAASDVVTLPGA